MKRSTVAIAVAVLLLGAFFAVRVLVTPQEARAAQQAQIAAVVDISPIAQELTALRKELAAIREAVTDAKGIRGDLAKAGAAVKAMDERMTELADMLKKYTEATEPVIKALKPPLRWEYRVLRNRSDRSANHLGRQGWLLVTGSQDWLFFKRPLPERAREAPEE